MQTLTRVLQLDRAARNSAARTVPATLSSPAPVARDFGNEVLLHTVDAIDMSRASAGLPLLFSHDREQIVGRVELIRLENNRLKGLLRFSDNPRASEVWADVEAGILTDLSVGYSVSEMQDDPLNDVVNVTRWTPLEISIVTIPADATVGIGRAYPNTQKENTMQLPTREEIRSIIKLAHLDEKASDRLTLDFISRGLTEKQIVSEVLTMAADASDKDVIRPRMESFDSSDANPTTRVALMAEVLASRCGGPAPTERAKAFGHLRFNDMLRDILETRGVSTKRLSNSEILSRAMNTTGDYPELLLGTGNRILQNSYASYRGGIKRIAKQSTIADFRAKQVIALGSAPALEKVNEHGEFSYGSTAELKNSYSLQTFGKIFGISRQALVNDDLGAFGNMISRFGIAAAETEAGQLVKLLTSNPTLGDGVSLFHATHGNLASNASAISVDSLGAARKAMRLQTGLGGTVPIDCTPSYLVVPAALETLAEQFLATLSPTVAGDTNPFSGRLELVVDPRLDAISATAWYLAAKPEIIDTIEYAYLEGFPGPVCEVETGFEVDGTQIKCRLDFGAGILDHRGLYKNAGV